MPDSYIFGGNTGLTYEELKRRRAIAQAIASRQRGYPKNIGEGLTYLGESIGDTIGDMRLRQAEKQQSAADAQRIASLYPPSGAPAPQPPVTSAPPAAPRPLPVSAPPRATPQVAAPIARPPPPPPPPPPPVLPSGPSAEALTSGPPPSDFAAGGMLSPAPLAAPGLEPAFPGEGQPEARVGILPSSGYLAPPAAAAVPSSSPPPPMAVPTVNAIDTAEYPVGPVLAPPTSELQPPPSPQWKALQDYRESQGLPREPPPDIRLRRPGGAPAPAPPVGDAPGSILGPQSALTPRQRDIVARTIYGEASNQADVGQQAVANVILNRARMAGTDPEYEALKRNQFEPWWNAKARARMESLSTEHPAYQRAQAAIDAALASDPTGGATHFYSPSVQAALGRRMPSWDRGDSQMIGTHKFLRLPYGGQQPGAPSEDDGGNIRLASYAPSGGTGGAPIPGMGGAGAIRMRGSQPSPDEQVTPTDIEPAPPDLVGGRLPMAQFGPPVGRFSRSDAPMPGIPPAAALPPDRVEGRLPTAPLPPVGPPGAPPATTRPSQEPIPPAQEQEMPDPGPPPVRPAPRPYTPEQRRALEISRDPNAGPPAQAAAQQVFGEFEDARKRQEQLDISDYTNQRTKWEQDVTAKMKFDRERHERLIEQQTKRLGLEKTVSDLEKARYEAGTPRQQAEIENALKIAKAQRDLFAEETVTAGGTQFRRSYTGPGALGPGGMPTGTPGGAPPKFEVPAGLPAPKDEPLTEAQQSGLLFAMRVRPDLDRVDTHYNKGKVLTDPVQVGKEMLPGGNALVTDEYRTVRDSLGNWGAGFLSKVSGQAVTPGEATRQLPAFIPRVGDTQQQLDEKSTRRRDFTNAIEKVSSPGGLKEIKTMMDKVNDTYNLDVKMREWAEKNPSDPRAKDIKNRLGIK